MIRYITSLTILCGLLLLGAETASAHGHANGPRHHSVHVHRDMPASLKRRSGFRHWYFRSPLRHNYRLAWWQLYEIYRLERRYSHYRRPGADYVLRHRDWNWYRRYWRNRDHEYRRHEHGSGARSRGKSRVQPDRRRKDD